MTNEVGQIIATIKRHLKAQNLTYRDVSVALDLSEASVKRLFSSRRMTVERLAQLGALLGFTLAELAQEAAALPALGTLSIEQEMQLVSDRKLLVVAVCALSHWPMERIVATYQVSRAECIKYLLVLERMGLIALLPGDRIRLVARRDFHWLRDGPIRAFFRQEALPDFLANPFSRPDQMLEFAYAMLSAPALEQLQQELLKLRTKLALLHDESLSAPPAQRRGMGLLLAAREWEPAEFARMRRPADAKP